MSSVPINFNVCYTPSRRNNAVSPGRSPPPAGFKRSRPIFHQIDSSPSHPTGFATLISWARPRAGRRSCSNSKLDCTCDGKNGQLLLSSACNLSQKNYTNYHEKGVHGSRCPFRKGSSAATAVDGSRIGRREEERFAENVIEQGWIDYSKSGFTFFLNEDKKCNCGFMTEYQKEYNPQAFMYVRPVEKPWWNGREMTSKFDRNNLSCPTYSDVNILSTYSKDYHWTRSQPTPLIFPQGGIERAKEVVEKTRRWDYFQRGLNHHLIFAPGALRRCPKCQF